MIKIITDSSCDIANEEVKQTHFEKIPLFINIGEKSYQDGVDISREEFYKNLNSMIPFPKTSAPGPEIFQSAYRKAKKEGYDGVISIHVSGKLSATINSAYMAAAEITDFPVKVIDSQNLSGGAGFIVEEAIKQAQSGKTLDEILVGINDMIPRTYTFAILENLDHLQNSGRMGQFITTMGSILKIRIMLKMNRGKPGAEQFRTMKKGLERLAELTGKLAPFEKLVFLHTNNLPAVDLLKQNCGKIDCDGLSPETMIVNPVLGTHLGPTAVGFSAVTLNYPDPTILEKGLQSIKQAAQKIHLPDSFPNPFERKENSPEQDEDDHA